MIYEYLCLTLFQDKGVIKLPFKQIKQMGNSISLYRIRENILSFTNQNDFLPENRRKYLDYLETLSESDISENFEEKLKEKILEDSEEFIVYDNFNFHQPDSRYAYPLNIQLGQRYFYFYYNSGMDYVEHRIDLNDGKFGEYHGTQFMKRIFGLLFCITFVLSIVYIFVMIWNFNAENIKITVSLIIATFLLYHLDEAIIQKYGK